eukprot:Cvel_36197.t1-p1 / transcript=Cvel_36197.t1 / gene=Cvel_36197 / organism=Chromera_velia_CCMP2878 / gene_product=hypothetical protein / transcript_product=hypothetical protein / location=Cvel_scaffold7022:1-2187(-) / protein_length=397 / sequence_SO=supercontig / SO=protein_coding / is_pseudo=false
MQWALCAESHPANENAAICRQTEAADIPEEDARAVAALRSGPYSQLLSFVEALNSKALPLQDKTVFRQVEDLLCRCGPPTEKNPWGAVHTPITLKELQDNYAPHMLRPPAPFFSNPSVTRSADPNKIARAAVRAAKRRRQNAASGQQAAGDEPNGQPAAAAAAAAAAAPSGRRAGPRVKREEEDAGRGKEQGVRQQEGAPEVEDFGGGGEESDVEMEERPEINAWHRPSLQMVHAFPDTALSLLDLVRKRMEEAMGNWKQHRVLYSLLLVPLHLLEVATSDKVREEAEKVLRFAQSIFCGKWIPDLEKVCAKAARAEKKEDRSAAASAEVAAEGIGEGEEQEDVEGGEGDGGAAAAVGGSGMDSEETGEKVGGLFQKGDERHYRFLLVDIALYALCR